MKTTIKRLYIKALFKLHLNSFFYSLAKRLYKQCTRNNFNEQEVTNAWNVLHNYHRDVKTSAITQNTIDIKFDLHIIIPVYNVEKYILQCLDSILSQKTRYSYYITIINDGSTDNSRKLLCKYELIPNIEIIDQKNIGLSGARNRGLQVIKGKYVTFVDSDDLLHEDAINNMIDAAVKYNADIVQGGYNMISEKNEFLRSCTDKFIISETNDNFLKGFPWGKIYKADLFKNIHFPEQYWFEDTICAFLLFPLSKIKIRIEDIVYNYRVNKRGITFTSIGKPKILDTLYITNSLLKDTSNFEYSNSNEFYTKIYQQIKINQNRISTIPKKDIQIATFIIHCFFIEHYFTSQTLLSEEYRYKEIENAIKTHNYKLYILATRLL